MPILHLYEYSADLLPLNERFDLTLKMIAIIRIMMKDINIVAATALQAIDPMGREKAIMIGANIIMPNITPGNTATVTNFMITNPALTIRLRIARAALKHV